MKEKVGKGYLISEEANYEGESGLISEVRGD